MGTIPFIYCLCCSMCVCHMIQDQNSLCSSSSGSGNWSYQNLSSQCRVAKTTFFCRLSLSKFCARACSRLQKPLKHGSSLVVQIKVCYNVDTNSMVSILEKVIAFRWTRHSLFVEPVSLLLTSQAPDNGLCPHLVESSPFPHALFLQDPFLYYASTFTLVSHVISFRGFPANMMCSYAFLIFPSPPHCYNLPNNYFLEACANC